MNKQSNLKTKVEHDIETFFDKVDDKAQAVLNPELYQATRRSIYHNIRHTTHGTTAPFINMPLGQTRVYVERIR